MNEHQEMDLDKLWKLKELAKAGLYHIRPHMKPEVMKDYEETIGYFEQLFGNLNKPQTNEIQIQVIQDGKVTDA